MGVGSAHEYEKVVLGVSKKKEHTTSLDESCIPSHHHRGQEAQMTKKKVRHRHRYDRCWNLVHKAEATHIQYCKCGKRKP